MPSGNRTIMDRGIVKRIAKKNSKNTLFE
jgi:hypothetical protein